MSGHTDHKTKLCISWLNGQICRMYGFELDGPCFPLMLDVPLFAGYGDKCTFAHGPHELRPTAQVIESIKEHIRRAAVAEARAARRQGSKSSISADDLLVAMLRLAVGVHIPPGDVLGPGLEMARRHGVPPSVLSASLDLFRRVLVDALDREGGILVPGALRRLERSISPFLATLRADVYNALQQHAAPLPPMPRKDAGERGGMATGSEGSVGSASSSPQVAPMGGFGVVEGVHGGSLGEGGFGAAYGGALVRPPPPHGPPPPPPTAPPPSSAWPTTAGSVAAARGGAMPFDPRMRGAPSVEMMAGESSSMETPRSMVTAPHDARIYNFKHSTHTSNPFTHRSARTEPAHFDAVTPLVFATERSHVDWSSSGSDTGDWDAVHPTHSSSFHEAVDLSATGPDLTDHDLDTAEEDSMVHALIDRRKP